MNTPTRLVGFSVILAAALGAGYGTGAVVGPLETGTPTSTAGAMEGHATSETVSAAPATGPTPDEAADAAGGGGTTAILGLNAAGAGYALVASSATVAPGPGQPFAFTITGPDAAPVTAYTEELHLLGVRRDGGGYQHVHPARDASGQWHAMLDMSPGPWRLIADTVPAGASARVTLVMDVAVTGDYTPTAPTQASTTATVADYTVT